MDIVVYVALALVVVPVAVGVLAGEPVGYWIWGSIVSATVVLQGLSGEVQFFTLLVFLLGACGVPGVMAGVSLRRRLPTRR